MAELNLSNIDCPQYVAFTKSFEINELENEHERTLEADGCNNDTTGNTSMLTAVDGDISTCTAMTYQSFHSDDTESLENYADPDLSNFSLTSSNFPIACVPVTAHSEKRSILKPTVPKPFRFETDNRLKSKGVVQNGDETKDFSSQLRKNTVLKPIENHVTKVQPFNLHEGKKRKQGLEYLPLAEQVTAFHTKTPDRYHTYNKGFQKQQHWSPLPLNAKTPILRAVKRRRVGKVLSRDEQEENELKEMKAHEFHAKPVNPKIFAPPPDIKPLSRPALKSKRFSFRTDLRGGTRHFKKKSEKYRFRARPVPTSILNGPTGIKEKSIIQNTKPKSPNFASDKRIEKRKELEKKLELKKAEESKIAKKSGTSSSHCNTTIKTVSYEKKPTVMKPFSFDQADKERYNKKEQKIQEEIECGKKVHVFKAQLLPCDAPSSLPAVQKKQPTQVKPFNFTLDSRVSKNQSTAEITINASFKARPATVLDRNPFVPEKPMKHNLEVKEFNLHTNKRANEWQLQKQKKEAEDQERERVLLERKASEEAREHEEIKRLRSVIVHKANPMPNLAPFELKPSELILTVPQTPKFETEKRIKARHETSE